MHLTILAGGVAVAFCVRCAPIRDPVPPATTDHSCDALMLLPLVSEAMLLLLSVKHEGVGECERGSAALGD